MKNERNRSMSAFIQKKSFIITEESEHPEYHVVHMGVSKVTLLVSHKIETQKKWTHDTDRLVTSLGSKSTPLSPC